MNTTDIHDRDTWLAFRADWRVRYRIASDEIRSTKRQLREIRDERRLCSTAAERSGYDQGASIRQGWLHNERLVARSLMDELDAAKERKAKLLAERAEKAQVAA